MAPSARGQNWRACAASCLTPLAAAAGACAMKVFSCRFGRRRFYALLPAKNSADMSRATERPSKEGAAPLLALGRGAAQRQFYLTKSDHWAGARRSNATDEPHR